METKLIVGLAAILLAVPAGLAATYTHENHVTGPSHVKTPFGYVGVFYCDSGALAAQLFFIDCGTGGIGAKIPVSDIATSTNYVSGTCNVKQASSNVVGIGTFHYMCGTDRDNDGFVTRADADSVDIDGWDDDLTDDVEVAPGAQGSTAVCFRADTDSTGMSGGYPTSAHWDYFYVFIASNLDSASVTEGTFDVDVVVSDTANGGCIPSSHTHGAWS